MVHMGIVTSTLVSSRQLLMHVIRILHNSRAGKYLIVLVTLLYSNKMIRILSIDLNEIINIATHNVTAAFTNDKCL